MTHGALRLMVDTNVWVDNYCGWHAGCEASRAFLDAALQNDCVLMYAVHEAKDLVFVLWQEYKRIAAEIAAEPVNEQMSASAKEVAYACLENLCELATAVGADVSDVWLARKYLPIHRDFEDNLVLAACKRAEVDYLVTSDCKFLRSANVAAKTPGDMKKLLEAGMA